MAAFALSPDSVRANTNPLRLDSNGNVLRLAPIVPAGPRTFAAAASEAPTRRGLLGAFVAIPALAMAATGACAPPAVQGRVSPELVDEIRYNRRASGLANNYSAAVAEPAYKAWRDAVKCIPHATTENSFVNILGERITLTTADEASVAGSRSVLRAVSGESRRPEDVEYFATLKEQLAAVDARNAESERLAIVHRVTPTSDRVDRLVDIATDAISKVIALPARNAADMAAKIAFIAELDWWEMSEAQEAIAADARRLAGEA